MHYRGTPSLGDSSWKQACACPGKMLPHPSRLFAANTTLRKGPCIPGTQQGCAGMLRSHVGCLFQEHCSQNLRSRYNYIIPRVFSKSGCVSHSCRINHASLTVTWIAEKPEPQLSSLQ